MKECQGCKNKRGNLQRCLIASFSGKMQIMKICKECKYSAEKSCVVYKIDSENLNFSKYSEKVKKDLQALYDKQTKDFMPPVMKEHLSRFLEEFNKKVNNA